MSRVTSAVRAAIAAGAYGSGTNWLRVHDATTKDGKPTEPNVDKAKVEVVPAACWSDTNFKFADQSDYQSIPDVSANFTWKLYLAGAFSTYSGTGCK